MKDAQAPAMLKHFLANLKFRPWMLLPITVVVMKHKTIRTFIAVNLNAGSIVRFECLFDRGYSEFRVTKRVKGIANLK